LTKNWLTIQGPQSTTGIEWAWAIARIVVVLTVALGAWLFMGGNPAQRYVLGAVAFVFIYDLALAALIARGQHTAAFKIGFVLDHVVLISVWWLTLLHAEADAPNDLYLVLFPVLVVGVVRVGWAIGLAYTVLLIGWMAWADLRYQPADSYPVDQLPIRVAFLVLVAALVTVFVYNLQRARREAERQAETMAAVQRSMTEGLVVFSAAGIVEYCNPVGAAICGTTPEDALGQTIAFLCDAAAQSGQTSDFVTCVAEVANAPVTEASTIHVGNDRPGAQHYAITTFPIAMDGGEYSGLLIRDVTEQWELEQRQFGFVSIAAHELRTPLTAVMGFSELLQTRKPSEEKRDEWVGYINAESHHLAAVLDEILSVTRIQSGETTLTLSPVSVGALVTDTLRDLAAIAPERVITVNVPEDVPEVEGDAEKLKQVLLNLTSNAIKYSPNGEPVELTVRYEPVTRDLHFAVTDHGMGIAARDRTKLFTSFARVRNEQTESIRGTGLGLYICRKLVEAMGGDIWFDSTLGQGSTFTFTLPLDPPSQLQAAA
jgi:signal transduction histidine kinase